VILPALYVSVPPVTPQRSHRSDYDQVPHHGYYKLHTLAKTWEEARRICLSEGSRLLVLNSAEEFNALKAIWDSNTHFTDTQHVNYIHIGLRKSKENTFVTDSGKKVLYTLTCLQSKFYIYSIIRSSADVANIP
jgi:hypothetical protein